MGKFEYPIQVQTNSDENAPVWVTVCFILITTDSSTGALLNLELTRGELAITNEQYILPFQLSSNLNCQITCDDSYWLELFQDDSFKKALMLLYPNLTKVIVYPAFWKDYFSMLSGERKIAFIQSTSLPFLLPLISSPEPPSDIIDFIDRCMALKMTAPELAMFIGRFQNTPLLISLTSHSAELISALYRFKDVPIFSALINAHFYIEFFQNETNHTKIRECILSHDTTINRFLTQASVTVLPILLDALLINHSALYKLLCLSKYNAELRQAIEQHEKTAILISQCINFTAVTILFNERLAVLTHAHVRWGHLVTSKSEITQAIAHFSSAAYSAEQREQVFQQIMLATPFYQYSASLDSTFNQFTVDQQNRLLHTFTDAEYLNFLSKARGLHRLHISRMQACQINAETGFVCLAICSIDPEMRATALGHLPVHELYYLCRPFFEFSKPKMFTFLQQTPAPLSVSTGLLTCVDRPSRTASWQLWKKIFSDTLSALRAASELGRVVAEILVGMKRRSNWRTNPAMLTQPSQLAYASLEQVIGICATLPRELTTVLLAQCLRPGHALRAALLTDPANRILFRDQVEPLLLEENVAQTNDTMSPILGLV